MKKIIVTCCLVAATVLCLAACGEKKDQSKPSSSVAPTVTNTPTAGQQSQDEEQQHVTFNTDDEYIVFMVSGTYELKDDAWLGVIPTGTRYEKEVDADEVDITYAYCNNSCIEGGETHDFAFEKNTFFEIEDGKYDMVLCSSDNEERGVVLLQVSFIKKGQNIVFE